MSSKLRTRRPSLLNKNDVDKLYHHFLRFDADGNGYIDADEFLAHPAVSANPLSGRVLEMFDTDGDGHIDFGEFVTGLARFSGKGDVDRRLRFIFDLYDVDRDGYISNGEMFLMLRRMTGAGSTVSPGTKGQLTALQLQQVVDRTIRDLDTDGDGRLSWEEFRQNVGDKNAELLETLCIKNL
jgi:serine/threonine-protein phosphatase 2B regulatory subunit